MRSWQWQASVWWPIHRLFRLQLCEDQGRKGWDMPSGSDNINWRRQSQTWSGDGAGWRKMWQKWGLKILLIVRNKLFYQRFVWMLHAGIKQKYCKCWANAIQRIATTKASATMWETAIVWMVTAVWAVIYLDMAVRWTVGLPMTVFSIPEWHFFISSCLPLYFSW